MTASSGELGAENIDIEQARSAPSSRRARLTRALWVISGLMWAVVVLGWPLLALAQLMLTPEVESPAVGDPPTLSDVGFLVFIIVVPAAVVFTGFAAVSGLRTAQTPTAAALRTTGLVVLIIVLAFVAFMTAQLIGFFLLSPLIATAFQLN